MTFAGGQVLEPFKDTEVKIHVSCPYCGRHFVSEPVAETDVRRILHGERVQDVFPDWDPSLRELFLLTGTCAECWRRTLGGELITALEQIAVLATVMGLAKAANMIGQA